MKVIQVLGLFSIALCASGVASLAADDDPVVAKTAANAKVSEPAKAEPTEKKIIHLSPFRFGIDAYQGISNMPGQRRFSDGQWAGSAVNSPSTAYLRWQDPRGQSALVSIGMGGMYTGSSTSLRQPVEGWYQTPVGKMSATVGKFWVPFGQQEWEYESKPGAMLAWEHGRTSVSLAGTYNTTARAANSYLRATQKIGDAATVGLSFGYGRGATYDSGHDRLWGADAAFERGSWSLNAEFVQAFQGGSAFTFGFARMTYLGLGKWQPTIGLFGWGDQTDAMGRFRSTTYGLAFEMFPGLVVEGSTAATSNGRASWLQFHWAWER